MIRKPLVTLATVAVLVVAFAVSAVQVLAPRNMPFGVTGSSPADPGTR